MQNIFGLLEAFEWEELSFDNLMISSLLCAICCVFLLHPYSSETNGQCYNKPFVRFHCNRTKETQLSVDRLLLRRMVAFKHVPLSFSVCFKNVPAFLSYREVMFVEENVSADSHFSVHKAFS